MNDTTFRTKLGEELRRIREDECRLSTEDVYAAARAAGIRGASPSNITSIEKGESSPAISTVYFLCQLYKKDMLDVLSFVSTDANRRLHIEFEATLRDRDAAPLLKQFLKYAKKRQKPLD